MYKKIKIDKELFKVDRKTISFSKINDNQSDVHYWLSKLLLSDCNQSNY